MPDFPYKPRAPRRPPEAPEPETPEQSDRRFLFVLLRMGLIAALAIPVGLLLVATGALRSFAALALVVYVVLMVAVPRFRRVSIRAWLYWDHPLWWYTIEQDRIHDMVERDRERDENDIHRGDHLL